MKVVLQALFGSPNLMMVVNHFDNMGIFQISRWPSVLRGKILKGFHGGGLNMPMSGRVPTAISTNRKAHAPRPCFFLNMTKVMNFLGTLLVGKCRKNVCKS